MKALTGVLPSLRVRRMTMMGAAAALALTALPALSQSRESPEAWPTKPVKLVVPFTAGGGTDIVARLLATALEPLLGQPVVIENRAGAGGGIGTQLVSKSPADGYTVLHGTIGTNAVNQYLFPNLPYDPLKDFAPVTLLTKTNCVVTVATTSPFKSLADMMKFAKANPGKLNYGITNFGDACHLGFEKLKHDAKIFIVGIPYNSVPTTITDLVGGRVDLVTAAVQSVIELTAAGRLRPLAVTGDSRALALPDVPTVAESGFPGFAASGWQGYFLPAGTPPAIVSKLSAAVAKVYQQPDFQAKARARGLETVALPPEKFTEFVAAERIKWAKVIKDANVTIQ